MKALALACLVASLAGCYSPGISDGQFTCGGGGACPSGFSCQCGLCVSGAPSGAACGNDLAMSTASGDMRMSTMGSPCSNGGKRANGDPGLAGAAVCPAAWSVAGLLTAPSCGRHPTQNGMSSSGMGCAAADNCASGWHICRDEAELTAKGFGMNACHALTGGLWVTLEPNVPPSNPPSGPPQCGTGEQHFVFGCGDTGGSVTSCSILDHSLTNMPGSSTDGCSTMTGGAFVCGTNLAMGTFEINVVKKPMIAGGGVLCCAD